MALKKEWADLSPDEKQEERFERWLNPPGVEFSDSGSEEGYKKRVTRFIKAIKLEEPDRVPVMLPASNFPAFYTGGNLKKVMYDYNEMKHAWLTFLNDFKPYLDSFSGPGLVLPGNMLDRINYKIHHWPGHGIHDGSPSHQYIEGEYMKPDEYDIFINDPMDFLFRIYLPRIAEAFAGFRKLSIMTPFIGIPVFYITQFGDPEIKASLQALMEAGEEGAKWNAAVMEVTLSAIQSGFPPMWGGLCGAPFDLIGDMMRGTKGIMIDMYQRPEKLIDAMERLTPILINEAIGAADASGCPIVFMPLHKGTGGFMSNKQYETYYWPTFKKVMTGLINEGLVPMPFAEGDYRPRLDIIKDMPRGKVIWYFETMDMINAKNTVGKNNCIAGNLPVSVLCTGKPEQVKEGCRELIETCAQGGGYILTASAHMDEGDPENLKAMMDAAKEYGVY